MFFHWILLIFSAIYEPLIKQNLLHRHKFIPLFLQFIHDFQCRGHRRGIVIVHQYYIVLLRLIHHFIYHTARIFRTPVQRIHGPEHRNHIQFCLKRLIPCTIGRPYEHYLFARNPFDNFIGLYQFFLEFLSIGGF